jgi:hypothetical protein
VTIDGPAVVIRGKHTPPVSIQYPQAGTMIELERARTIVNPLAQTPLQVKSVVIYDGDVALTRPAEGQVDGRQVRVEGDGVMPQSLADYRLGIGEFSVLLDYVTLIDGIELPLERTGGYRVIGPVAPSNGSAGQEEYIVWIGTGRG